MSTCPKKFPGYQECEKIPACDVAAFVDLQLDPENPTGIILSSSWGGVPIDLLSIVKAGETITKLELVPADNPTAIRYMRENGEYDCITGDELSRIISLQYLKDVDQTTPPEDGATYVFNGDTNLFEPYDIKTAISDLNVALGRIQASITNLQNRISNIEAIIPFWPEDSTTKLARGDINYISDPTNTNDKTHGLFTHDKSVDQYADTYDA